jgi:hypothetical protein
MNNYLQVTTSDEANTWLTQDPSYYSGSGPATKASGFLGLVSNPVLSGTFQIGTETWTFVSVRGTSFEVELSFDALMTAGNMAMACNSDSTQGLEFQASIEGIYEAVLTITAATAGAWGNSIGLVSGSAELEVSGPYLTGGSDASGYPWVISDRMDLVTHSPYALIGFQQGMKIKLIDPLATGPNHNKILTVRTVASLSDWGDTRGIYVQENLVTPDTTSYAFEIIKPVVPLPNMRLYIEQLA